MLTPCDATGKLQLRLDCPKIDSEGVEAGIHLGKIDSIIQGYKSAALNKHNLDCSDSDLSTKTRDDWEYLKKYVSKGYEVTLANFMGDREQLIDGETYAHALANDESNFNHLKNGSTYGKKIFFSGLLNHGEVSSNTVIHLNAYVSLMEALEERPWYAILINKSLSGKAIYVSFDSANSVKYKCDIEGCVVVVAAPPLEPGTHAVRFWGACGERYRLRVTGPNQLHTPVGSTETQLELPLTCVVIKRLSGNYTGTADLRQLKMNYAPIASGTFNNQDLKNFHVRFPLNNGNTANFLLPQCTRRNPKALSETMRLQKTQNISQEGLLDTFTSKVNAYKLEVQGRTPGTHQGRKVWYSSGITNDMGEARIPEYFKMMLWDSCDSLNRLAILYFHKEIFELKPFGIQAAHLFMKSHPEEEYSIFSFTLACPPQEKKETMQMMPELALSPNVADVASLDRFEASERLCADVRMWKYVDSCVPSKTEITENFQKKSFLQERCPVPPLLKRSRNIYKELPDGLEIAPLVYLYYEPWDEADMPPEYREEIKGLQNRTQYGSQGKEDIAGGYPSDLLDRTKRDSSTNPVEKPFDTSTHSHDPSDITSLEKKSEQLATTEKAGGNSLKIAAKNASTMNGDQQKSRFQGHNNSAMKDNFFSVCLLVGKTIFASVTPVNSNIISFIVGKWLPCVPRRGPEKLEILRQDLIDPIEQLQTYNTYSRNL